MRAENPVSVLGEFLEASRAAGSTYTAETLTRARDSASRMLSLTEKLAELEVDPMQLNTAQAAQLVSQARLLVAAMGR